MESGNIRIVKEIMKEMRKEPVMQIFVICALDAYAKMVQKASDKELENPIVNGQAMKKAGARVLEIMEQEYSN